MSDSPRAIYDPRTGDASGANRTVFAGNIVPANRQSSIARKLADLTPLPNLVGLTNNYYAATSYIYDRHRADTKLNWNILPKWTAFGRFSRTSDDRQRCRDADSARVTHDQHAETGKHRAL